MKKIALLFAALAPVLAFTSCDESSTDHPTLTPNEGIVQEDFLNIPEMSNMSVELTADNETNAFHLTCSQPSYGYAATVRYDVEVSLNEDFTTPAVEGLPATAVLATPFYDCSAIDPSYGELATAICDLLGLKSEKEVPTGFYDIYVRLVANIEVAGGASLYPNTTYISNIVKLTRANCTYLAIIVPGEPTGLYLRGGMNDWGSPSEWEFVTTDAAGVYEIASCTIDAGVEFKVADANWGPTNLGGNGTDIEFGKPYELQGGDNPPNITMPKKFSGRVQLTAKGGMYTILFEAAEPETPGLSSGMYVRGGMNGWGADPAWEFLTTEVKNVWLIQGVTIGAGEAFKVADPDWASVNLGGAPGETLTIGAAFTLASGGENIVCPDDFSGDIELKVQGGAYKLTLIAL